MKPILFEIGHIAIPSYGFFLALAFGTGFWMRHLEKKRLGWERDNKHRVVSVAALLGAVVGSKLGMVFFLPAGSFPLLFANTMRFDFSGKTVVGALIGGYIAVEIAKKVMGIRKATGDGFAVAIPLAQGVGRLGCFLHGCCFGAETSVPWSVFLAGTHRHPAQLYEAALDFLLAALLFFTRRRPYPNGHLFRRYILGYAIIRFFTDFFRGDPANHILFFTVVQWISLATALAFGVIVFRGFQSPLVLSDAQKTD